MKVAIQGQIASFHHQAAKQFFNDDIEVKEDKTFADVFESVRSGEADYGVVAIENSLFGSINQVYDLLKDSKAWIVGEVYLHITHSLVAIEDVELTDIKEVHSHFAALGQCSKFLREQLPQADIHEAFDTAGAVQQILEWGDPTKAAIASVDAANEYGATVLKTGIETNPHNYTRFIFIAKDKEVAPKANKTSIILKTSHQPGALHQALGFFREHDVNLSKLESRPKPGPKWEYMFYLDFETGLESEAAKKVLNDLKKANDDVVILGSYKQGSLPEISIDKN